MNVGQSSRSFASSQAPLHWVASDDPFRPLPLEVFMRQYYTPRLLARLLAGAQLRPLPGIGDLNRLQRRVEIASIGRDPSNAEMATVTVKIASTELDGRRSGLRDLRLFRDGRLVGHREGQLTDGDVTFGCIRLPGSDDNIAFSAYVFNDDLVKSATSRGSEMFEKREVQPRAFLVNIGGNYSRAAGCQLNYAVADATGLQSVLSSPLGQREVSKRLLVSVDPAHNGASKERDPRRPG